MQTVPPNYSYVRWAMIAVAALLFSLVLWQLRNILMLALAAAILALLISMPVTFLGRLGISRVPAMIVTFLGGILLIYVLILLVLPTLLEQFIILAGETIPDGIEEGVKYWNSGKINEDFPILEDLGILDPDEQRLDPETIDQLGEEALNTLRQLGGSVVPFLGGLANTFLSLLIVIFLTIYFMLDPDTYSNGFVQLFPIWYRHRVRFILERLAVLMRRWMFVALIGVVITGIGMFIGFSLIGLQQAAALAILTGILSFVPNFGEMAALVISLVVGAVQVPDRLPWIVVVVYGVSFIQGQMIMPFITQEGLKIPPVLLLLGQIIVAGFFGVLGIVLAVPLLAIMMVVVQEVYIKDILGDWTLNEELEERPKLLGTPQSASTDYDAEMAADGI